MLQILLSFVILMSTPTVDSSISPKTSKRMAIAKTAKSLVNTKYKYGGKTPKGFDCSGFTQYVFNKALNIKLGASSRSQVKQGKTIKSKDALPGDLIFFKRSGKVNHVGIIYKIDKKSTWVIHSTTSKGVILEDVKRSTYWRNKVSTIKRVI